MENETVASGGIRTLLKKSRVNCCVYGCSSRYDAHNIISLHQFPTDRIDAETWRVALRVSRRITKYDRVCSLHFKAEDFSQLKARGGREKRKKHLKRGIVPTQNIPRRVHDRVLQQSQLNKSEERQQRIMKRHAAISAAARQVVDKGCSHTTVNSGQSDNLEIVEFDTSSDRQVPYAEGNASISSCMELQQIEIQAVLGLISLQSSSVQLVNKVDKSTNTTETPTQDKGTQINKNKMFFIVPKNVTCDKEIQVNCNNFYAPKFNSLCNLLRNTTDLVSMTGISSFELLDTIHRIIEKKEAGQVNYRMTCKERICMTMMRIKMDISFLQLAVYYQCTSQTCINYFQDMVPKLSAILKCTIKLPSAEEIRDNLPICFGKYKDTRIVLDGTESKVERTGCLKCRILTYSFYKSCNTLKWVIGVSPAGLIIYVSETFGGRASDKAIVNRSKILYNLSPHQDAVMVDKGFLLEKECEELGLKLIRPPFLSNKKTFNIVEANKTQSIARARVHVERSIGRVKQFKLLAHTIPAELIPLMDHTIIIACGLVNLSNPILASDKY